MAAGDAVRPHGYVLESLQYNNAFFVRRDVAQGRFPDLRAHEAYDQGYRYRSDRKVLFPWNHDMEDLLQMAPDEAVWQIRSRFSAYQGRFVVEVRCNVGT